MTDNKRFDNKKTYKGKSNKSRNTFKGEREITRKLDILTGEVQSNVLPTYIQTGTTQSQFVNFLFKEMEYQPYGSPDLAIQNPISLFTQSVLDTAITSTTRNSTSNRAVNTWKQRYTYLDTVAKAYAFYCSTDQWVKYFFEPRSMNYGVNYSGRIVLNAEVLNAYNKLGILLQLHAMPKMLQATAKQCFTWRQAGDSAESAIIGLTTIKMSVITEPDRLLAALNSQIKGLEDLNLLDANSDYVCANMQTTLNKQGMDWSIEIPDMPGILAYEKEYLTLFLHSATSRGTELFPVTPDTYSYIEGTLTPFTCAHIADPNWMEYGILNAAKRTGSITSLTVSINTLAGFDRINIGNSDIAKKLLGLPSWYLQTDGSGNLLPPINMTPGGKIIRGITASQQDMLQQYLYEVYEIANLAKNFTKRM